MSDAENRLMEWIRTNPEMGRLNREAMLQDLSAALSRARAEALEEVRVELVRLRQGAHNGREFGLSDTRASGRLDVIGHLACVFRFDLEGPVPVPTAPASIPVEKVREEIVREFGPDSLSVAAVFERLGVDLDTKEEAAPSNLARCGCGCYASSHRNNVGPCIINGCECSGFLAASVTP